ncbi:RagB/SusD family nutrient uptake outer membrane protein [Chitinophaga pendula]|uniref:RagB/SusD family nutrient uptake outer membrane protein n=1 Tax=Chitinophaga TaxID=79328 RepID=UPI000BAF6D55|nr:MULTISPECIES: RagB/SusD family nutrient uptake outer membrane protein [Chitinophaga]ASZ13992.1 RagB/SusD family nutrient uptake outer membrane protein [Chitinophaga sp. MD30]UCJ08384.1 RagB/SusD family nutrient uptake outer membrane protein [Chitinophaga pendula]
MKRLIILLPLLSVLFWASCKKDVEEGPLENLDEDYIFDPIDQNGNYAEQFLTDIYANLPTGFNRISNSMLDAATDDAVPSQNGSTIEHLIFGRVDPFMNPEDVWSRHYGGIRKVNIFLSKIDRVPKPKDVLTYWKMEARFLRAYFYFELVKRYGGVPLMGDKVPTLADDLSYKRNSFEECINYIVSELDDIRAASRPDPVPDAEWGRSSQAVVLALKSRVLLYAASALFNGGNIGSNAAERQIAGYATYDAERWRKAAQAADAVIKTGIYGLESSANYVNIFVTRRHKEIILAYMRGNSTDVETNNGPVGFTLYGFRGYTSPTQDLAEAFLMKNNKPITDPTSGYNPNNPASNRDNRFAMVFLYNGARWFKRNVETFEGGLDKPGGNLVQTKTGYYLKKFCYKAEEAASVGSQSHNFPLIRYAEILLNFAEATNEADGPTSAARDAVTQIRARGGLPAVPGNISQEEFRAMIRNERRVELCFEEHRYWDLRRWKTAASVLNKDLRGSKITRDAGGSYQYAPIIAGRISFNAPRAYLYPIPQNELYRNRNLFQNPGW